MKKSKKVVIPILLLSISVSVLGFNSNAADTARTKEESIRWTKNFLRKQQNQRLDDVENEINKVNKDTSVKKFDMSNAKRRFEDVVFLGDSITEYLREANILNSSSVLAVKGEHVNQAKKHIKEIKNLKPKQIVILYGANDLNAYSADRYKQEYLNLVKEIKRVDPGVNIYIQAPLPVDENITTNKDSKINNDNVAILAKKAREVARETKSTYLPSDGLISSKTLYEGDGIHLKYGFYKNWLYYLSENL